MHRERPCCPVDPGNVPLRLRPADRQTAELLLAGTGQQVVSPSYLLNIYSIYLQASAESKNKVESQLSAGEGRKSVDGRTEETEESSEERRK